MNSVPGTVWKALLMSIVAISVMYAGSGIFRPSCMYCISVVRVTWLSVGVGDRGMCGAIVLRISGSRILTWLHNNENGL